MYRTPPGRRDAVRTVREALRASRRAILTTHVNADGDGTGSEVALAAWLRSLGNQAFIVNPTPFPPMFDFLLPEDGKGWVVDATSERARDLCARADLAVVLDTGEVARIGRMRPLIRDLKTVVVDHHPPGDRAIGGISFRDPDACATGEMIYDLVLPDVDHLPEGALKGIYTAILTDTGSFRFSNATPGSHRVSAELIERGVDPEEIYDRVYGTFPLRRYRLLQVALESLDTDPDAGVTWMTVPRETYDALGIEPDELEGLVDYPRSVEGTEVALLFRRTTDGDTKVSFRSNGRVDVNVLARRFDGGGHVKASGALVKGPPEEVVPRVVEATREAVKEKVRGSGGRSGEVMEGTPGVEERT